MSIAARSPGWRVKRHPGTMAQVARSLPHFACRSMRAPGASVEGPLIVNEPEIAIRAALDGVGLAYLFDCPRRRFAAAGVLRRLLDEWSPPFPGFYVYYPSRQQMPPALRAFLDFSAIASGAIAGVDHRENKIKRRETRVRWCGLLGCFPHFALALNVGDVLEQTYPESNRCRFQHVGHRRYRPRRCHRRPPCPAQRARARGCPGAGWGQQYGPDRDRRAGRRAARARARARDRADHGLCRWIVDGDVAGRHAGTALRATYHLPDRHCLRRIDGARVLRGGADGLVPPLQPRG